MIDLSKVIVECTGSERPICRVCSKPVGETAALDPCPPMTGGHGLLHTECRYQELGRLAGERAVKQHRLEKAAVKLLAACEAGLLKIQKLCQELGRSTDIEAQILEDAITQAKGK